MKTRFAPSPTGLIHLGNARTALFSALYAAAEKGHFLLRIEDTDGARSTLEFIDALVADLKWLGVTWQEGEGVGGSEGPYRQSARGAIYDEYYEKLKTLNRAYPCYCTDEELSLERKLQQASSQPPRYAGRCKHLTPEQQAQKEAAGLRPSLRFAVVKGEVIEFEDGVKGLQSFKAEDIGDFVIQKQDGSASFMFCNAIDDSKMGVTHVLRGEDHLTNTPRQLMILKALGLRMPGYAHLALINGLDGAPLSKRNGSRSIRDLREAGFLPLAVLNYMARLGHYYDHNALMNLDALAQGFALKHLGTSAARFDQDQLLYWQRVAVHQLDDAAFWQWSGGEALNIPEEKQALFVKTIRENVLFPSEVARYAERLFTPHPLAMEHAALLREAGASFFDLGLAALATSGLNYEALTHHLTTHLGVKGKALFMPLRVALTGEIHGPALGPLLSLMGVEEAIRRLAAARELF